MQTTSEKMGIVRRTLLREMAFMKSGIITPAWMLTSPRDRTYALHNFQ